MKRCLAALMILLGSAAIQGCGGTEPTPPPAPATNQPMEPGNPDTTSGPAGIDPSQK